MYENNIGTDPYMGRDLYSYHQTGKSGTYVQYKKGFMDAVLEADNTREMGQTEKEQESWEEKLKKFDEEIERIKEENKRERKRIQEERIRKKRIQKKLLEKLAIKKYLARQDEIQQLNEKIALERSVGEDVYIEKPPLSKSLSVAEIMAICSQV